LLVGKDAERLKNISARSKGTSIALPGSTVKNLPRLIQSAHVDQCDRGDGICGKSCIGIRRFQRRMSGRLQSVFETALLKQSAAFKDFEFERPRRIGGDESVESAASFVLAFYELAANKVFVGVVEVGFWISA
jgi:hypothetical protein